MRTRNRRVPVTEVQNLLTITGYGAGNTHQSGYLTFDKNEVMTDQKTPGYFRAAREGDVIPVSPMTKTTVDWLPEMGSLRGVLKLKGYSGSQYLKTFAVDGLFLTGGPSGHLSQARNLVVPTPVGASKADVLQAALAKAQTDAWDTATFLAELGKTVEMLTSMRERLFAHAERVRAEAERRWRRYRNTALTLADVFSQVWLEWRYGIRPLIYDAQDILRAYEVMTSGRETPLARGWVTRIGDPQVRSSYSVYQGLNLAVNPSSGTKRMDSYWVVPDPGLAANGGSERRMDVTLTRERVKVVRATVGVAVTTRSATMFDPIVTSWELVPFSFIADWIINMGEAIAAFSPFATGLFKYATFTVSELETVRVSTGVTLVSNANWDLVSVTPGHSSLTLTRETKVRTIESPTPTLNVRLDLDAAKIVDLVAIVVSMKSRFLRSLLMRR